MCEILYRGKQVDSGEVKTVIDADKRKDLPDVDESVLSEIIARVSAIISLTADLAVLVLQAVSSYAEQANMTLEEAGDFIIHAACEMIQKNEESEEKEYDENERDFVQREKNN